MALGVAIEAALISFRHVPVLTAFENLASDLAMRSQAVAESGRPPPLPMGLIDVDEETWRSPQWNEAYAAPRPVLLRLLRFAAEAKPRVVVLDTYVEEPATPEDAAFVAGLAALPTDVDYVFVRSVRRPLYDAGAGPSGLLIPRIQPSPVDEIIRAHTNFHIAAPYFATSRDGVVRSWRLWTLGCRTTPEHPHSGQLEAIPSVQLVIAALVRSGDVRASRATLAEALKIDRACATDFDGLPAESASQHAQTEEEPDEVLGRRFAHAGILKGLGRTERALEEAAESRILFRYGGTPQPAAAERISALSVLDEGTSADRAATASFAPRVRGGVVVIGQSNEAAGDTHPTPLGAMAGGMILLNAAQSAIGPGVIREPPWELAFSALCIVAVGYVFARTTSVRANALAFVGTILITAPLSLGLLKLGLWLNFAAPLIALAVHRAFAEIEEYVTESAVDTATGAPAHKHPEH